MSSQNFTQIRNLIGICRQTREERSAFFSKIQNRLWNELKGKAMLRGKATQTLRSENIENVVWYDFLLNIEVGLPHSLQQDGSVSGMGRPAIEL